MKLKKESKVRVLENFYSLDYVLFGKPVSKVDTCCPVFVEEYLSIKGALMSLVIEMYKLVKHSPTPLTEKIDSKNLTKMAKESAIIARENCKKLVTSEKGREDVKQDLRESLSKTKKKVDVEKMVQEKIRTKAYSLAVDNLLVGRAITESKKFEKLNTWNGRIIEDAYKILRDNLVESAMSIIENGEDLEPKKKVEDLLEDVDPIIKSFYSRAKEGNPNFAKDFLKSSFKKRIKAFEEALNELRIQRTTMFKRADYEGADTIIKHLEERIAKLKIQRANYLKLCVKKGIIGVAAAAAIGGIAYTGKKLLDKKKSKK